MRAVNLPERASGVTGTHRIARWDGSAWSALGDGLNNSVQAITVEGSSVYAGGWFTATAASRLIISPAGTALTGPHLARVAD